MTTKTINSAIARIDNYDHLRTVQKGKKGSKTRRRVPSATIPDPVSESLSACETPAQMGSLAVEYGVDPEKVLSVADNAPNFGQFRMVIGNMVRAAVKRRDQPAAPAKPAKVAKKTTKKAATPKAAPKVAKKTSKKAARKTTDKVKAA